MRGPFCRPLAIVHIMRGRPLVESDVMLFAEGWKGMEERGERCCAGVRSDGCDSLSAVARAVCRVPRRWPSDMLCPEWRAICAWGIE